MVMYKREQGAEEPGGEWNGPARLIGLDDKILWMIHNGTPIVGAPNRCRPPHASERLSNSFLIRTGGQFIMPPAGQQNFVDVRAAPVAARKRPLPESSVDRSTGEARMSDGGDDEGMKDADSSESILVRETDMQMTRFITVNARAR